KCVFSHPALRRARPEYSLGNRLAHDMQSVVRNEWARLVVGALLNGKHLVAWGAIHRDKLR
ncbi:hypothetical protein, partial [Rhizobium sp.]|uniref:hypothetical protein n=1 Tax=Rhizobium sp. TaxID=391 RepID=UPI0028A94D6F